MFPFYSSQIAIFGHKIKGLKKARKPSSDTDDPGEK
jgi:hypothetical protein